MARDFPLERYRNIGIMAHIDAGKTTTTERILFYTGTTHKMGDVRRRQHHHRLDGAGARARHHHHLGGDHRLLELGGDQRYRINIIDTPGHVDFTVEVERSLRVLDGAIAVFDAANGVEPQSETVWRQADRYGVPRICFINKMDRAGGRLRDVGPEHPGEAPGARGAGADPLGREEQHQGVIDLVRMKGISFDESELGSRFEVVDIPASLLEAAKTARAHLIEACADQDDRVMALYLDGKEPSEAELLAALRKGCIAGKLFPVLCGSAFKHKGVQPLLDAVVDFLPSPLDIPPVHGKDPEGERHRPARRATPRRSARWRSRS